jgi:hypothetical protein
MSSNSAICGDVAANDVDVPSGDPFDPPTTWESAWIDLGGEG